MFQGAEVPRLWEEHVTAEFPARLRGEEVAGIDMVMLDADVAGLVVTWRETHRLQQAQQQLRRRPAGHLDRVLPLLENAGERAYYARLRRLAALITATQRRRHSRRKRHV